MTQKTKKVKMWDRKGEVLVTITRDYDKKYPLGFKEIKRTTKRLK